MAATLVIAAAGDPSTGPESRKSGRMSEIFKITSAAASVNDTGTLTTNWIKHIEAIIGPVTWLIADLDKATATVKTAVAIGSTEVAHIEVIGQP